MSVDLDAIEAELLEDSQWAGHSKASGTDMQMDPDEHLAFIARIRAMIAEIRRYRLAADCLATTVSEQHAEIRRLREALEGMTDLWLTVGGTELNPAYEIAVAALEAKGGE